MTFSFGDNTVFKVIFSSNFLYEANAFSSGIGFLKIICIYQVQ